jgi:hypothetical protein
MMKLVARIVISLVCWAAGIAFGFVTDGKPFNGLLWLIGAGVAGALPWVRLPARDRPRTRFLGMTIVALSSLAVGASLVGLPQAHRQQQVMQAHKRLALR